MKAIFFTLLLASFCINSLIAQQIYSVLDAKGVAREIKIKKTKITFNLKDNNKVTGYILSIDSSQVVIDLMASNKSYNYPLTHQRNIAINEIENLKLKPHKKPSPYLFGTYYFVMGNMIAFISYSSRNCDGQGCGFGFYINAVLIPVGLVVVPLILLETTSKGRKVTIPVNAQFRFEPIKKPE